MLQDFPIHATAAASDLEPARGWYERRLGLVLDREDQAGACYQFAGGTWLYLYRTPPAGVARNTITGWTVTGIEGVIADLRKRGVAVEDYDFDELRTVGGRLRGGQGRLVKDSEGNTYELRRCSERADPTP